MAYLVDTNVLLRYLQPADPAHAEAVGALDALFDAGEDVYVTPQNLIEFWNVATRPQDRNGFGMSPVQAEAQVQALESILSVAPDDPAVFPEWRRLVLAYAVTGVQVHDTRLVAAMRVHGITHVLTFNAGDFNRFVPEGITVVLPARLASPSS